jgi:hypothetical protein
MLVETDKLLSEVKTVLGKDEQSALTLDDLKLGDSNMFGQYNAVTAKLRTFAHSNKHSFVKCGDLSWLVNCRNCVMHPDQNFAKLSSVMFLLYALEFDSLSKMTKPLQDPSSFCSVYLGILNTCCSTKRVAAAMRKKIEKYGLQMMIGKMKFRMKTQDPADFMNLTPTIYRVFLDKVRAMQIEPQQRASYEWGMHVMGTMQRLFRHLSQLNNSKTVRLEQIKNALSAGVFFLRCFRLLKREARHNTFILAKKVGFNMVRDMCLQIQGSDPPEYLGQGTMICCR